MEIRQITTPLDETTARSLKAGDYVEISGTIYTARDAAHKRLCASLAKGEALALSLHNQILYFTGPTPAPPQHAIGSAGPTTSGRMDLYSPALIAQAGLKGMIGKGNRSDAVVETMKTHGCVNFSATGGAGAFLSQFIKKSEILCYPDLGTEAIHMLHVEKFPVIVSIDTNGGNLYEVVGVGPS